MEEVTDLLLAIYRAARECAPAEFQELCLRLIKPLLHFQSAMWGTGRLSEPGIEVHTAHLHEIAREHILQWQSLNPGDKVIPAVCASPGRALTFHAPTLFASRGERPMLEFTSRAGWQSAMVTAFVNAGQKAIQWLSLYRPDAHRQFVDADQNLAQHLVPHLVEALTINRAIHLRRFYSDGGDASGYLALCDHRGLLHFAEPGFVELVAREYPQWDSAAIPRPLLDRIARRGSTSFTGRYLRLRVHDQVDLLFLRARKILPLDLLSPRELEVARLFGRGKSHKEIAKELGLAPATIRHHLSSVYATVGAHDKAELSRIVQEAE